MVTTTSGPRPGRWPRVSSSIYGRLTVELVFPGTLTAYSTEILQGVLDAGTEVGVTVAAGVRCPGRA